MTGFNLADNYRAAGLTAGPDVLRTRQEPFDKLRKAIDPGTAIDLTRLYFGLPVPRGTDWFRDAFGEADASFSLVDNAREASVLAAGLLESASADGKIYAALAILTTAAGGLREPPVRPRTRARGGAADPTTPRIFPRLQAGRASFADNRD